MPTSVPPCLAIPTEYLIKQTRGFRQYLDTTKMPDGLTESLKRIPAVLQRTFSHCFQGPLVQKITVRSITPLLAGPPGAYKENSGAKHCPLLLAAPIAANSATKHPRFASRSYWRSYLRVTSAGKHSPPLLPAASSAASSATTRPLPPPLLPGALVHSRHVKAGQVRSGGFRSGKINSSQVRSDRCRSDRVRFAGPPAVIYLASLWILGTRFFRNCGARWLACAWFSGSWLLASMT